MSPDWLSCLSCHLHTHEHAYMGAALWRYMLLPSTCQEEPIYISLVDACFNANVQQQDPIVEQSDQHGVVSEQGTP